MVVFQSQPYLTPLLVQSSKVPFYQSKCPHERDEKLDEIITMSTKEISKLEVMQRIKS
jgi:hypothetical protein